MKARPLWIFIALLVLLAILGVWRFNSSGEVANADASQAGSDDSSVAGAKEEDLSAMKPTKLPRKPTEGGGGKAMIRAKMEEIIIPIIDFGDTSIEEAIDFLRLRSRELDPEPDPAMKGLGFRIRKPQEGPQAEDGGDGLGSTLDPGAPRIKELRLKNVSLWDALHRIADESGLKVEITEYAIELSPK